MRKNDNQKNHSLVRQHAKALKTTCLTETKTQAFSNH